jgi:hypothetical protein
MRFRQIAALFCVFAWFVAGCASSPPRDEPGAPRWYKGNLHTHSFWSDGDDYPERIAKWYRDRGYNFLGISDHNTAQEGDKWVKFADVYMKGAGPATEAYLRDFPKLARTRGQRAAGTQQIRLTPFDEYRPALEVPGQFILVRSEEISDKFEKKPIHMNATNLATTIKPQGGNSVVEVIANNLRAIQEQGRRLGRAVLPHLNHPNFGWGVTAEELAQVVEERFFEIYNGHPDVHQPGDKDHPSVERIWDVANTLRMTAFGAPPLMGLATDDSHHYHVEGMSRAAPGRGWIYVRARELTPEALIASMEAGDFYASSGIVLEDVKYDRENDVVAIDIAPDGAAKFTTQFVGTPAGPDAGKDPAQVGIVFATVEGRHPSYRLTGKELYVRAIVTSDRPPVSPSIKGQMRQAWTQPAGWESHLSR